MGHQNRGSAELPGQRRAVAACPQPGGGLLVALARRCRGGVSSSQALARNRRACRPDSGGQVTGAALAWLREGGRQRRTLRAAEYRGGAQGRDGP